MHLFDLLIGQSFFLYFFCYFLFFLDFSWPRQVFTMQTYLQLKFVLNFRTTKKYNYFDNHENVAKIEIV